MESYLPRVERHVSVRFSLQTFPKHGLAHEIDLILPLKPQLVELLVFLVETSSNYSTNYGFYRRVFENFFVFSQAHSASSCLLTMVNMPSTVCFTTVIQHIIQYTTKDHVEHSISS